MDKSNYYIVTKEGWVGFGFISKRLLHNAFITRGYEKYFCASCEPKREKGIPNQGVKHACIADVSRLSSYCLKNKNEIFFSYF